MDQWPDAGAGRRLLRALGRRCLRCGSRDIFRSYFSLRDECPTCRLPIEREDGYWVGALTVNIGAAVALYGLWIVGGLVLFWPDPHYTVLLVGGVALMGLVPLLGYPWSKMLWWWIDTLLLHPPGPDWTDWTDEVRREQDVR